MSRAAVAPRVVITGFGSVGALGCGEQAMRLTFQRPPALSELDLSAGYHRPDSARCAVLVDTDSMAEHLPARQARRMSPPSRFAVIAARLAWQQAGLEIGEGGDQTSVVTSTSYGPSSFTESLLRQILLESPSQASPFLFTEAVANAPAAQIALLLKAQGANITLTQREAGPLLALAKGAAEIRAGRARRVVVAAVEEANPLLHAVLDRFGVLAGSRGSEEVARPFDRKRMGFHLGEGAAAIVLEAEDAAADRGVQALGVIGPLIGAFDSTATRAGYGRGVERLSARLLQGLGRLDLTPADFDLAMSGSSGGRISDQLEARVFRSIWPGRDAMPPLFVPKACTGDHGAGILTGLVVALTGGEVAATPGFIEADPELGIVPFGGGALARPDRLLVSCLAVGGSAAWLVIESLNR